MGLSQVRGSLFSFKRGRSHAIVEPDHVTLLRLLRRATFSSIPDDLTAFTAKVLYIGVTNNLSGRFWEHTEERSSKFVNCYNLDKLVFYETYSTPREAIAREKQLKGWRREKKIALIEAANPRWSDLSGYFRD